MGVKVFLSGSRSLTRLNPAITAVIDKYIASGSRFLVGDARGADTLFQSYFAEKDYTDVTVYTIYSKPRNLASDRFKIKTVRPRKGLTGRQAQMEKDRAMCRECDVAVVYWDGRSKGSKANLERCSGKVQEVRV